MALKITLGAILVCLSLFKIVDATGPSLTASPDQISSGLTDTLDINCTLSLDDWPDVAALVSLSVSTKESELGIISGLLCNGYPKVTTTDDQVTASGYFSSNVSSFINLHWNYPTYEQNGLYTCKAVGLNSAGATVEETTQVQVYARSPALSDLHDKVIQMDIQMKEMQKFIRFQEAKNQQQMSTLINLFDPPIHYKGHSYYLYKFPYTTVDLAQATCMLIGGYLAEINDREELSVIQKFLKTFPNFHGAVIAGTDEGHEGRWTLPNGDRLPFTDWVTTNRGKMRNCIVLWEEDFQMNDFYCAQSPASMKDRFLCEVPQIKV